MTKSTLPNVLFVDDDVNLLEGAVVEDRNRRKAEEYRSEIKSRLSNLTPRGEQVLGLIADGKSSKQIAGELCLSQRTVEKHRARIMSQLHATSMADLLRMVLSVRSSPWPGCARAPLAGNSEATGPITE